MKTNRKNLHQTVARRLELLLNGMAPGARLPGMRELARLTGAGQVVLTAELRHLQAAGRIRVEPRRGMFKVRLGKCPAKIWFFSENALPAGFSGFGFELLDELRRLAAEEGGELAALPGTLEAVRHWPEWFPKQHVERVFLHSFSHDWFRQIAAELAPHTVEILPRHTAGSGFALVDNPDMSEIQLRYLFSLGYRRIGCIHNVEYPHETSFIQYQRLADFYRIMAEHALEVKKEWVFCGYGTPEHFAGNVARLRQSGAEAVITAGTFLKELYRVLENQHCRPGHELGILSCDELPDPPLPEPATLTNSPREIARDAWQLMAASVRGETPRIESSRLRIVVGYTLPGRNRNQEA